MKAVIFNSGLGSRMGMLTKSKPKCLVELYNGETILERQIRILSDCGITDFIVTTGPYKEQFFQIVNKYSGLNFSFVDNPDYMNTNYIVSMNNAYDFLDDDILLLHGDLVFNTELIRKILKDERKSLCLFNEDKKLPEKDFKGRFLDNVLKEVSISIFDEDCYAFQPLYKLSKNDIFVWKNKVKDFVNAGNVKVYAENALNEITNNITIYGMSYRDDYIEEIDNEEDYIRVSSEIKFFDYREQKIEITTNYTDCLKEYIDINEDIFVVCSKSFINQIIGNLTDYNITIFSDYSPNPKYEEIKKGIEIFNQKLYKTIISIGGGSTIDVAKCIKLFSSLKSEYDFLESNFVYNSIKHIAIPTTAGTGSESTQFAVMYYRGDKLSIDHGSIFPNTAILDYTLLKSLSDYQKKSTLLDSLCQAIESYWSRGATKESKFYAERCISFILSNYENYLNNDYSSYKNILLSSNYSGRAINISRTTAAHSMSYKLTSMYGISHGHAVALCIIPVWRLLQKKSQFDNKLLNDLKEISTIFGTKTIEESIYKLSNIIKQFEFSDIKISSKDIKVLSESVDVNRMHNNPVVFTLIEIENLYKQI